MARTWQEHYCIADNLLRRIEMSPAFLREGKVPAEYRDTLDLVRAHATLASLRVEPDHVQRWNEQGVDIITP